MKIIYDDIIYSLQKSGGGSVYWAEVTKRITENCIHYAYDNADTNFVYNENNFETDKKWSSHFLMFKRYLNLDFNEKIPFIFHSSMYRYCKSKNSVNITTVHDFTYEYFRKDLKSNLHKIQKKNAVMHSDGVICISENTKNDLLKFYPNYKGKIKVVYNGYSTDTYFYEQDIKKTKKVLFVGSRTEYKRFDLCVRIMQELQDCCLYIIGGGALSCLEMALLEKNLHGRYKKIEYVSNEDLRKLYNEAFFLCYPSEYEGFGIPIVEAQACGCPVVCQRNSCIPEVAAGGAIYFDANSLEQDLPKIKSLFYEDTFKKVQSEGLKNVKRFSWDKCAKETSEFYQEVLRNEKKYK